MTAYLLTWNPEKFDWTDVSSCARQVQSRGRKKLGWSCGNTRRVEIDAPFFLLKQGKGARGIIGSGTVLAQPTCEPHWDDELRRQGKTQLELRVQFDTLLDPADEQGILKLGDLDAKELRGVYWAIPASGTRLPTEAVPTLTRLWKSHYSRQVKRSGK